MDLLNKILLSLFHQYQMQPLATAAMLAVTLVDSSVNSVVHVLSASFIELNIRMYSKVYRLILK